MRHGEAGALGSLPTDASAGGRASLPLTGRAVTRVSCDGQPDQSSPVQALPVCPAAGQRRGDLGNPGFVQGQDSRSDYPLTSSIKNYLQAPETNIK